MKCRRLGHIEENCHGRVEKPKAKPWSKPQKPQHAPGENVHTTVVRAKLAVRDKPAEGNGAAERERPLVRAKLTGLVE